MLLRLGLGCCSRRLARLSPRAKFRLPGPCALEAVAMQILAQKRWIHGLGGTAKAL